MVEMGSPHMGKKGGFQKKILVALRRDLVHVLGIEPGGGLDSRLVNVVHEPRLRVELRVGVQGVVRYGSGELREWLAKGVGATGVVAMVS
mgnify:FL=1